MAWIEYRRVTHTIKMSTNNITIVMKQQIVTALKQIWSKMDTKSSPDAVAQEMFAILFPEDSAVPKGDDSDKESTSSKRSEAAKARWANKSEEEKEAAKAKLAAGRAAAKAKKAQAQETPPAPQAPAPKAEPATEAPAKTSRSDAAKARWAAMSEEEKQAAKDKLAAGRAAKKAAKETGAHV
jgi:chemotaxis protein histidine kinase CheA